MLGLECARKFPYSLRPFLSYGPTGALAVSGRFPLAFYHPICKAQAIMPAPNPQTGGISPLHSTSKRIFPIHSAQNSFSSSVTTKSLNWQQHVKYSSSIWTNASCYLSLWRRFVDTPHAYYSCFQQEPGVSLACHSLDQAASRYSITLVLAGLEYNPLAPAIGRLLVAP